MFGFSTYPRSKDLLCSIPKHVSIFFYPPKTKQQRILWTPPLNHAAKNLMDSSPQPCSEESYGLLPSTMQQRILRTSPLNHAAKNLMDSSPQPCSKEPYMDSSSQPRRKEPFGILLVLLRLYSTQRVYC